MFDAALLVGEDFAGVTHRIFVEDAFGAGLELQVGGGEHEGHEVDLLHADAVFTGDRAAEFEASLDDGFACLHDRLDLFGIAVVEVEAGVEVAIAGMKDVGDADAVGFGDVVDGLQHFGEFRARDNAVVGDHGGGEASHRADAFLAGGPELRPGGFILGDFDVKGVVGFADLADGGHFGGDRGRGGLAVRVALHQEKSAGSGGIFQSKRGSEGTEDATIHHLKRGRDRPGGDDAGDGLGGGSNIGEGDEGSDHGLGQRGESNPGFGYDAEGALSAHDEADEVEAGSTGDGATEFEDLASWVYKGDSHHMPRRDAVFEGVGTTSVLGDVATEGGHGLGAGIGGKVEAVGADGVAEALVGHSRLGSHHTIRKVDLEDLVKAFGGDHNASESGQHAPAEAGTGSPSSKGNLVFVAPADDASHLLGIAWQNDGGWFGPIYGVGVAVVGAFGGGTMEHRFGPEDTDEGGDERRVIHAPF